MAGREDAQDDIQPGHWMRWPAGRRNGRIQRLLHDDHGGLAGAVLEADGGGWIATAVGELTPISPRGLN